MELQGIDLDQYRTQAKELLKLAKSDDSQALERFRQHHPEKHLAVADFKLSDAQLVLARELGFDSWPKLREHLVWRQAVRALYAGDIRALEELLDENPSLHLYRNEIGHPYESGYFRGATLLYHIAGNPDIGPIPGNVVDITRLLLSKGASQSDLSYTIGLLLTSRQASEAKVAVPLVEMLHEAGGEFDLQNPGTLKASIFNVAANTAEGFVAKGAKLDANSAAGLGRLSEMIELLGESPSQQDLEEALVFASVPGRKETGKWLIERGAKGDVVTQHAPGTAMHEAASRGYIELVRWMLEKGADPMVRDSRYGGTVAAWCWHSNHSEVLELVLDYMSPEQQAQFEKAMKEH